MHLLTMLQQAQDAPVDDVAGEEHSRELEVVVGKVEADKASLARQVSQQITELETRDSHILTLDSRLSQRNTQIIELQEDVARRCEAIARLEKEVSETAELRMVYIYIYIQAQESPYALHPIRSFFLIWLICIVFSVFVLLQSSSVWGFYSKDCVSVLCSLSAFTLTHFFVDAFTYIVVIWLYAAFTHMRQMSVHSLQEMLIARHLISIKIYKPVPSRHLFSIDKPVPDTFFHL